MFFFTCAHVLAAKAVAHQHPLDQETLIQWSTMYDNWKSSWLPRSGAKLPSNLSSNATVGQHKLTPPPTLDTSIAVAQR